MEQTSPLPNRPLSKKPVLIIFLIVFVVVLTSLNAYLFLKLQNQPKKTPTASPVQVVQASPTPTLLPAEASAKEDDPTANWKTYTNNKYKFQFNYPPEWSIATDEIQENSQRYLVTVSVLDDPQAFGTTALANFSVFQPATTSKSLQEWFDQYKTTPVFGTSTEPTGNTSVANIKAIKSYGNFLGSNTHYFFKYLDRVFGITYFLGDNMKQYQQTMDQILSTFKFL